MNTRSIGSSLVPALASALLVGLSAPANAAFVAYICDDMLCTGGGDTIVTDQGVGDNFPGSALPGEIDSGALNVGGFTIVTNSAKSKPLIGSASQPRLNLTFLATTSDNLSHTIYLYASDTGFTGVGPLTLSLGGTQPGSGNSITGAALGGNTNTNLNFGNVLGMLTATTTPFALETTLAFAPTTNPYGLTIGVAITRGSAGSTGGSLDLAPAAAVPEPGSIALVGLGLLGLLGVRRRKSRAE